MLDRLEEDHRELGDLSEEHRQVEEQVVLAAFVEHGGDPQPRRLDGRHGDRVAHGMALRAGTARRCRDALRHRRPGLRAAGLRGPGRACLRAPLSWIEHARRCRDRRSPGGPEPAAAGGGHARRGAAADPRRRRLGQDARAHAPDRVPAAHRPGARVGDPRDHVHQQGRAGDARARRAARRPRHARDVGDDLPRRLRPHAARRRAPARLHAPVHDLRRGRLPAADQEVPRRPGHRHQALHPARDAGPDLRRQEQAPLRRRLPPARGLLLRADRRPTSTSTTSASSCA